MERNKEAYIKAPIHLVRCFGELAVMWCKEVMQGIDESLDCYGDDAPEDQLISSGRWS